MKSEPKESFYRAFGKRALDLIFATLLMVLFFPLLLLTGVLSFFFIGWPVLFTQPRPGKDGKIFKIIKFRTMTNKCGSDGSLLPDSERLGFYGRLIRKLSLDELPELLNVIKGEMSLIGPRPLLVEYLPLYSEEQSKRHLVRPGITGLAQVSGRNSLDWEDRFKADVRYVESLSLVLDCMVLILTFKQLLRLRDVSSSNHATMPVWRGPSE